MALTYNSPSYVGERAEGFIADLLLDSETIKNNWITVYPDIKKSLKIQDIETDAVIQARADAFTASGSTAVGERDLTPVNMMSQDKIGITVLLSSWQAQRQTPGANNNELPKDMGDFVIQRKGEKLSISNEKRIWNGDTTLTTDNDLKWHDGLWKKAKADSTIVKKAANFSEVTPTAIAVGATTTITLANAGLNVGDKITFKGFTGADAATLNGLSFTILSLVSTTGIVVDAVTTGLTITTAAGTRGQYINATNVIATLNYFFRFIPTQIRNAPDFMFYVSQGIADAYEEASLQAAKGQGNSFAEGGFLVYKRKKLAVCPYFPDNSIFASRVGNLFFGTDLVSDFNEVQALYMKEITLDDEYRYSAKFSGDVEYGFGSQITLLYPF